MDKGITCPDWIKPAGKNTWKIFLYVQPGAKNDAVAGETEGRLRVRIAARAVDNKANKSVTTFIAEQLKIRPNKVFLESGTTSRKKTLVVSDIVELNWNALIPVSDEPSLS
ncbi:UPF0235 protein [Deltaproteobacteria bacterium]|nr:UPF0235 protein [Deltaproteobacteria bacterium]